MKTTFPVSRVVKTRHRQASVGLCGSSLGVQVKLAAKVDHKVLTSSRKICKSPLALLFFFFFPASIDLSGDDFNRHGCIQSVREETSRSPEGKAVTRQPMGGTSRKSSNTQERHFRGYLRTGTNLCNLCEVYLAAWSGCPCFLRPVLVLKLGRC